MSRPIAVSVPDEFCNEEGNECPILRKNKYGYLCKHFEMYLKEKKSDDGITYDVIPCTTCFEGGWKEDKEKLGVVE